MPQKMHSGTRFEVRSNESRVLNNLRFVGSKVFGDWMLAINDMVPQEVLHESDSMRRVQKHGKGAISDWVLTVQAKDSSNQVSELTYHVDMSATVVTLPKYGTLYIANSTQGKGELIEAREGMKVFTAPCYNDCNHKFGLGNLLSTSNDGSRAVNNMLFKDRQVIYIPNQDFLGVDSFQYTVTTGTRHATTLGKVTLHVKRCRIDCKNDVVGRRPSVDENLRSPWNPTKTQYYPPDKFGEDGIIYNSLDCEFPPCNVIV